MKEKKHKIFFVDHEPAARATMADVLGGVGFDVTCFANTNVCLAELERSSCSLLITAMEMPGTDGMMLLNRTMAIVPWTPVMVISANGDVPTVVRAIKLGAVDFLLKPFDTNVLINKVKSIISRYEFENSNVPCNLTTTEKKVLKVILDGRGNKGIAQKMGCAVRTVEFHRSNIYHKFRVDNVVELTKKAMAMLI
ncbi:MAG: response regulator [Sedimentisphaerales bacterium]|jgi:FixJ family two-component response regulator